MHSRAGCYEYDRPVPQISSGDREPSAYYESKPNSLEALEVMVSNLEQIQKDFQELPEEAQTLLMDFIEILKKRYSKTIQPPLTVEKSPYQKFQESGFIGCVSVEEDLSTTYKQVLSESWGAKYDHC